VGMMKSTVWWSVFYFEKTFHLLLNTCGFDELATRESVKVALTVDGADLFELVSKLPMKVA